MIRSLLVVGLLGLCLQLTSSPGIAAGSTTEESNLGRNFDLRARARIPLITDIEVTEYVDRIGQKIVDALGSQPFTYHFRVVRDARINAFAVPGGFVYVHGGLLVRADNDDQIAGVLSHEIAHVNGHHMVRQQEATALLNYATLLGVLLSAIQPMAGMGAIAINSATQLQYRREFEQEADYLGARYMRQAKFDARGMLDFFKTMLDDQRNAPAFAPPYLLSHPLTEQRLTNLEAVLKTRQWTAAARPPRSLELERVQMLIRARTHKAEDVVALYNRSVDSNPGDARARYLLGSACLETGAFDAAWETLHMARSIGFVGVERELGRTAFARRDYTSARELLRTATAATPNDPLGHFELANTLQALNETDSAISEYKEALRRAPTLAEAHYNLGLLEGRSGQEAEGFFHIARSLHLRGEHEPALAQYERAGLRLAPGSELAQATQAAIEELKDYLGKK